MIMMQRRLTEKSNKKDSVRWTDPHVSMLEVIAVLILTIALFGLIVKLIPLKCGRRGPECPVLVSALWSIDFWHRASGKITSRLEGNMTSCEANVSAFASNDRLSQPSQHTTKGYRGASCRNWSPHKLPQIGFSLFSGRNLAGGSWCEVQLLAFGNVLSNGQRSW